MSSLGVKVNPLTSVLQEPTAAQFYAANPNGFASVKTFGATANGTTDDTNAINAALVAGSVFIPRGANQATASQTLTTTGTFSNAQTVTVGTGALAKVYTLKTSLASAYDVLIGANVAASLTNLAAAINGLSGAGTLYGTGTVASTEVSAAATATTLVVTSLQPGSAGNLIGTSETAANASWGAANMTGGFDSYIISNELLVPSNRTVIIEEGTVIKVANSSNGAGKCLFFRNSDYVNGNSNISITGGIFDGNNTNNGRNDTATAINGVGYRFSNVTGLVLRDIQIRNTQTMTFQMAARNVYAENLFLNHSVLTLNQDGFHINGPSSNIRVKTLYGNSNDDVFAINADGPDPYCLSRGDVTDVVVDGIRCMNSRTVGRLLTTTVTIKDITVRNVTGTTTVFGFEISSFGLPKNGIFQNIYFENWDVTPPSYLVRILAPLKSIFLENINGTSSPLLSMEDAIDYVSMKTCTQISAVATRLAHATTSIGVVKVLEIDSCLMKCTGGSNLGTFLWVNGSSTVQKAIISNNYANAVEYFVRADGGTITNLQVCNNYVDAFDSGIIAYPSATITNLLAANNVFKGAVYSPFAVADSVILGAQLIGNLIDTAARIYIFSGTVPTTPQRVVTAGNKFISVTQKFVDVNGTAAVVSVSGLDLLQPVSALTQLAGDTVVDANGNVLTSFAGRTVAVRSGTNAKAGTFTLVAGAATVANTSVTANSVIIPTLKTAGGVRAGIPDIVPTASTGFVATAINTDTSTYNYVIVEVG